MSKVLGKDVVISFFDGGFYKPRACALNCTLEISTDIIETTVEGAGNFATWESTRDSWSIQADGIVSLEETNMIDLAELHALQIAHSKIFIQFERTSITGQTYINTGYVLITNCSDTGNFAGLNTFSMTLRGNGILNQSFVPSPINPPGVAHRYEYTASGGETSFVTALLIGKEILDVNKDGVGLSTIITSGTPAMKEAKYVSASGTISWLAPAEPGEELFVIYQDM